MTFELIFFSVVAALAVASAIMMITRRNPVQSVLFLVVNFFCLAVLYLFLQAQFIAIIQILVYAGAIMVLFLFVIMLLNLGDDQRFAERKNLRRYASIFLVVILLLQLLVAVGVGTGGISMPSVQSAEIGTVEGIGRVLFSQYLLPFEVTSLLLLAAMVGVIVLAKKKFE